jgi:hypothetical protein
MILFSFLEEELARDLSQQQQDRTAGDATHDPRSSSITPLAPPQLHAASSGAAHTLVADALLAPLP